MRDSSLGRRLGRSPTTAEEMRELRRRAWVEHGVASFDPAEVSDSWSRQVIVNTANTLYGLRRGGEK